MAPACDLIRGIPAEKVLADRAYDADSLHDLIYEQGGQPVIPPRRHRKYQHTPKPLDKNIVKPAPASVHGQADAGVTQELCEPRTGELAALIGIEDVRSAVFRHRFFQGLGAELDVHRIAEPPGQDHAAEPVHDGDEV